MKYYKESRRKGTSYVEEKGRKERWISHNLRRNCLVIHVIEGKIEEMGRRGRRHKQLLDEFKEREAAEN